MGQGTALLTVFIIFISIIASGYGYFYYQSLPSDTKAIFCNDKETKISFVIKDSEKILIMAGETVKPEHIMIFNDSAIQIGWKSKNSETAMFMDRIAGTLEVETRETGINDWKRFKLNCQYRTARF